MAKKASTGIMNPLNANDLAGAQAVIDTADSLVEFWAKCTDCTMEVQPLIEQANALKAFGQKVIANFTAGASNV